MQEMQKKREELLLQTLLPQPILLRVRETNGEVRGLLCSSAVGGENLQTLILLVLNIREYQSRCANWLRQ